jgi:hypothetical protein
VQLPPSIVGTRTRTIATRRVVSSTNLNDGATELSSDCSKVRNAVVFDLDVAPRTRKAGLEANRLRDLNRIAGRLDDDDVLVAQLRGATKCKRGRASAAPTTWRERRTAACSGTR